MIELLSPAGDFERLYFAIIYGADAVYVGGKSFSLRANAINFTDEELKKATEFVHAHKKKIYVTVNIVFHNEDIEGLEEYLTYLNEIKVDAIIFSDPIVIEIVKKLKLNLELHLSTQASTLNSRAALFYKSQGVKRCVLAREASKENIIRIKNETGLDLECFVQGAMCTSFSGRCVLSNYMTNRDSNRGGCAQVCRWSFKNGENPDFVIMPKDLNMITNIASMIDIGVNSFKIEGRMRSIYYIASVIHTYRSIIDKVRTKTLTKEYINYATNIINRVANRESVSQFYEYLPTYREQYYNGRMEEANQDFLGLILSKDGDYLKVDVRNYFKVGEVVQIFGPDMKTFEFKINKILDEDGNNRDVCNHPREIVYIECPYKVCKNAMMRTRSIDIYNEI